MILQYEDILRTIAGVVAIIINLLKPILVPIGEWMIIWIEMALQFFPQDDLTIYFVIFMSLIIVGGIINGKWPGDKPPAIMEKDTETIDESIEKCKECGNPIKDSRICAYCGTEN